MGDNNSRLTPDVKSTLNLQPVASPVNQEIKYRFDTTKAEKTKNLADGLAKLGKGMVDIDPVLEDMADKNVDLASLQNDKNHQSWNDISKNIKGMAIFNPYNKDAYERMTSEKVLRTALLEVKGKPDLDKLTDADANKYFTDKRNQAMEALQKTGINPRNYADKLIQFDTSMKGFEAETSVKHQAYQYKLTNNSYQNAITTDLSIGLGKSKNKAQTLQEIFKNYDARMTAECGIPSEQKAMNFLVGLQNTIANNPDLITQATVSVGLKDLKIDGHAVTDFIPDFEVKCKEMVRTAQRASYEDKALVLQTQKLQQESMALQANTEFYQEWLKSDKSFATTRQLWQKVAAKYPNMGAEGFSFLGSCLSTGGNYQKFITTVSDPRTVQRLGLKAYAGTLTQEDINSAAKSGLLSASDCFSLNDAQLKSQNEGTTQLKQLTGSIEKYILNPKGSLHKNYSKSEIDSIEQTVAGVNKDVFNGTITQKQGLEVLQKYDRQIQKIGQRNVYSKNHWTSIKNGTYRAKASEAYYRKYGMANVKETDAALKKLGLVATKLGGADSSIASYNGNVVGSNRDGYKHVGTDVKINGAMYGRSILAPNDMTLIDTGNVSSMGNYAIYQDKYGRKMLIMHLQTLPQMRVGSTVRKGTAVGSIGNSGRVDGSACLHVEFWTADDRLIDPMKYLKGIS